MAGELLSIKKKYRISNLTAIMNIANGAKANKGVSETEK